MHLLAIINIISLTLSCIPAYGVFLPPQDIYQTLTSMRSAQPQAQRSPQPFQYKRLLLQKFPDAQKPDGLQLPSSCNTADNFAPCACKAVMTSVAVEQGGKMVDIEFQESVCRRKENRRRSKAGEIEPAYMCYQVRQQLTVSKDMNGNPMTSDVMVQRRNGCELRCVRKYCGRTLLVQ